MKTFKIKFISSQFLDFNEMFDYKSVMYHKQRRWKRIKIQKQMSRNRRQSKKNDYFW